MIKKGSKFRRLGDLVVLANMVHLLVFRTGKASLNFERKSMTIIVSLSEILCICRDSNPRQLGEKRERYLFAIPTLGRR